MRSIREQSPEYLAYIRARKCCVCFGPSDVHHLRTVGAGGSDYTAVPLCRVHHTEWHQMGDKKFLETHGVNLWKEALANLLDWLRHHGDSR